MVISSCGDCGDSVILLGIISQIDGGPHKLLLQPSGETKMKTAQDVTRWHYFFSPLASAQPYIEDCRIRVPGDNVDWESGGFRGSGLHSRNASLFEAQLSHLVHVRHMGREFTPDKPWLKATPSKESRGRIICNRSGRYRNGSFPWKRIVQHYGDLLLFVGLKHEHADFSGEFGMVEYRQTDNCLQIAELIAGSEMFIGNQSCAMTIAEGLKHRSIQETSTDPSDCIYKRDNAQWVDNGQVTLPAIGDREELRLRASVYIPSEVLTHTTPPGMWQVEGYPPMGTFPALKKFCQLNRIGPQDETLEQWIKAQNAMRVPEFFFGDAIQQNTRCSEAARRNAGYPPRSVKELAGL